MADRDRNGRVGASREDVEARGETYDPGPGGELASFPPKERWDHWTELDSNTFRRVQLRPHAETGLANFVSYFSTPALFKSIQNSLFIAVVSTVITVVYPTG